ncbi:hypothetical protein ACB092_12G158500 [Castanea dentata]
MAWPNPLYYLLPFNTKRSNLYYLTVVTFLCFISFLCGTRTFLMPRVTCFPQQLTIAAADDGLDFLKHHQADDTLIHGGAIGAPPRSIRRRILEKHAMGRRYGKVFDLDPSSFWDTKLDRFEGLRFENQNRI